MASLRYFSRRLAINPTGVLIVVRLDRRLVDLYFRHFLYRCAFLIGVVIGLITTKKYF